MLILTLHAIHYWGVALLRSPHTAPIFDLPPTPILWGGAPRGLGGGKRLIDKTILQLRFFWTADLHVTGTGRYGIYPFISTNFSVP